MTVGIDVMEVSPITIVTLPLHYLLFLFNLFVLYHSALGINLPRFTQFFEDVRECSALWAAITHQFLQIISFLLIFFLKLLDNLEVSQQTVQVSYISSVVFDDIVDQQFVLHLLSEQFLNFCFLRLFIDEQHEPVNLHISNNYLFVCRFTDDYELIFRVLNDHAADYVQVYVFHFILTIVEKPQFFIGIVTRSEELRHLVEK